MKYQEGDIVRFRPNWPTKPSFGIWMKDNPPEGKVARISGLRGNYNDEQHYSVQFDTRGDGSFYDCHWPALESEILGKVMKLDDDQANNLNKFIRRT